MTQRFGGNSRGATGAVGPAGPAGPAGPTGPGSLFNFSRLAADIALATGAYADTGVQIALGAGSPAGTAWIAVTLRASTTAAASQLRAAVSIDGGAPTIIGGTMNDTVVAAAGNTYTIAFQGSVALIAGVHTIKVQAFATGGGSFQCRAASAALVEGIELALLLFT